MNYNDNKRADKKQQQIVTENNKMITGETAINDQSGINESMFRLSLIGAKASEQRRLSALLGKNASQMSDRVNNMDILIEDGKNMFDVLHATPM